MRASLSGEVIIALTLTLSHRERELPLLWERVGVRVNKSKQGMTALSVNINKIALIRNSRGRNYPDVNYFAERFLQLGASGITLHPRPDQRHARYQDVVELKALCDRYQQPLNVEGYPTPDFLAVVKQNRPAQCTLVPDDPQQVTSDHGWDLRQHAEFLQQICQELTPLGIEVSLFVDYDNADIALAKEIGAARVELYTEPYAEAFGTADEEAVWQQFARAAQLAQHVGLGVNAGHDLNLQNLPRFVQIPNILEVSIGHALIVECLEQGIEATMQAYRQILQSK